jgi:hypothetical protein
MENRNRAEDILADQNPGLKTSSVNVVENRDSVLNDSDENMTNENVIDSSSLIKGSEYHAVSEVSQDPTIDHRNMSDEQSLYSQVSSYEVIFQDEMYSFTLSGSEVEEYSVISYECNRRCGSLFRNS